MPCHTCPLISYSLKQPSTRLMCAPNMCSSGCIRLPWFPVQGQDPSWTHTESCSKVWHKSRYIFAGWVTEGVSAFDELSGSAPVSIRQQALRGLAKIALERNDTVAAKAQYERILGKALMGRGRPAEHWAHSEYAWLVFEDGDLQVWEYCPSAAARAVLSMCSL